MMRKEIDKMIESNIIFPIHYSKWVINIFKVWKNKGDIKHCVDINDVNRVSIKGNFPLPFMDSILQQLASLEMMSLLGVFSRYNKTIINHRYHFKTNFTTRWGTFTCHRIPFGIINVGATFQRAMHIDFNDLKRVIIHIFLDDLTMHYNKRDDFFYHLKQTFLRCKKFGISFMPN